MLHGAVMPHRSARQAAGRGLGVNPRLGCEGPGEVLRQQHRIQFLTPDQAGALVVAELNAALAQVGKAMSPPGAKSASS
jgi:hypothetical protein